MSIVLYCLANGQDYKKAASHFQVSYQQVYGWVNVRTGRCIDNGPMKSF
ncbi:helix-turn-helix domain-containing protein [Paenibacillus sp. FSL K6-2524]